LDSKHLEFIASLLPFDIDHHQASPHTEVHTSLVSWSVLVYVSMMTFLIHEYVCSNPFSQRMLTFQKIILLLAL
jgi:hypothetical protein